MKADAGLDDDPARRGRTSSTRSISCADLMLASTGDEADQLVGLYGAEPTASRSCRPGVDHEVFSPGRPGRRLEAAGSVSPTGRSLLFVGRIQPLKGADLAVRALAALDDPARPRGRSAGRAAPTGPAELERLHRLAARARRRRPRALRPARSPTHGWRLLPGGRRVPGPAPHRVVRARRAGGGRLRHARWSRRRSAGCGRSSTTADTGFLVDGRDPIDFAAPVALLLDDPDLAARWP